MRRIREARGDDNGERGGRSASNSGNRSKEESEKLAGPLFCAPDRKPEMSKAGKLVTNVATQHRISRHSRIWPCKSQSPRPPDLLYNCQYFLFLIFHLRPLVSNPVPGRSLDANSNGSVALKTLSLQETMFSINESSRLRAIRLLFASRFPSQYSKFNYIVFTNFLVVLYRHTSFKTR